VARHPPPPSPPPPAASRALRQQQAAPAAAAAAKPAAAAAAKPSAAAQAAALLAVKAAIDRAGTALAWNASAPGAPCSWAGVECEGGAVTGVAVRRRPPQEAPLQGTLPAAAALAALPSLRKFSCSSCGLGGTLPADWAALPALAHVAVDGSPESALLAGKPRLSGPLPAAWLEWRGLEYLSIT
jgi:hypothetical protein